MSLCARMRVAAVQTWPEAPQTPIAAAAAASSRSASLKTMNGLLPPSSRLTGLTRAAAAAWIALPVATEPVNEIASTSFAATTPAPTTSPRPWTTLNTPGGIPASSASSAIRTAAIGVCSAGFITTELPAASAPATKPSVKVGPFHGVIRPTTPSGSRIAYTANSGGTAGIVPSTFDGQPAKYSIELTAASTTNVVYPRSRPASRTSSSPNRSARSASRAASRRRRRSFSSGASRRQRPSSNAARAERTAASTSACEPAAATAICAPEAGSMTGIVAPSADGTAWPSMKWPNSGRRSTSAVAAERGYVVGSIACTAMSSPLETILN